MFQFIFMMCLNSGFIKSPQLYGLIEQLDFVLLFTHVNKYTKTHTKKKTVHFGSINIK